MFGLLLKRVFYLSTITAAFDERPRILGKKDSAPHFPAEYLITTLHSLNQRCLELDFFFAEKADMIFSNRIQNYYLKVGTRRDNGFRIRRFRAQCIKTWKARNMHIPFVCPSVRPHLSHENPLSKLQWVFLHKSQSNTLVVPPNYPVFFRPARKFR